MKVTALSTQLVNLPLEKPIRTAIHDMRSVGCVCLTIHTDEGLVGEAYAFSLNAQRLNVFDEMIKGLAHLVVGKDPITVKVFGSLSGRKLTPVDWKE